MIAAENNAQLLVNSTQQNVNKALNAARFTSLNKPKEMTETQMNAVATDFESMFIAQMLSQMFDDSTTGNELFGSEESKEIYKGLMMDEYGKQIAKTGGIGIASYVKRELLTLQEANHE